MSFSDLGLSPETLKAVEDAGYSTPTPIQEQAIPYVLMGRDVLGIAQTGTGKTAGFTLPMIDILAHGRAKARMPRSLILAPTRELADQVAQNFIKYGKYQKLSMALLIGGESMNEQKKVLEKGVDVLIATPGRLLDLFERGNILLRDVKVLVIDEADRMLDMGFIPDVERIVSLLPPLRQTLFFSATMDKQIKKLADAFLSNPKEVRVAPPKSSAETVSQHLIVVDEYDKREALRSILRKEDVRNAFIFCNRKRDVSILYRSLTKHGFDAAQLHGDMPQSERMATLARFKAGEVRLLVCSDVAARGIDIADVSHVFNFDIPIHSEDYVHRIGRTGRAGREGIAYSIATPEDTKFVAAVESQIGKTIPRLDLDGIATQELSEEAAKAARRNRRSSSSKGRPSRPERGDRRDRAPRSDQAPAQSQPAEAPVQSAPAQEPRVETPAQPQAQTQAPTQAPTQDRGGDRRRANKPRSGGKGRRGHPAWDVDEMTHPDDVLAFGDHTPAFLLVDTSEAILRSASSDDTETEAEIESTAPESVAQDTEEKPKRRRTRRRKPAAEGVTASQPESDAATPAEAEAPGADTAAETAIDATAEAPAAPPEAAPEVAPEETQAASEDAESAPAEAPAPKPRATRRRAPRKAVASAATADNAESSETPPDAGTTEAPASEAAPAEEAAAPPKTRAPRRRTATKKAAEGADVQPTPETASETPATPEAEAQPETAPEGEAPAEEKPKRRTTARKTTAAKTTTAKKPATRRTTTRKAPAKTAAETEAPVEDTPSAEAPPAEAPPAETPPAEAAAETDAPVEEKPKRRTTTRKTTAAKTTTRKPAAKTTATARKTTTTRRKKADTEAPAANAAEASAPEPAPESSPESSES